MTGRVVTRVLGGLVATLILVAVLFAGVFPTRLWLDQRDDIAAARDRVADLRSDIGELAERADALRTPEEIERLARDEFLLVHEGERGYVIQPPPRDRATFPPGWPFPGFEALVNGGDGVDR